MRQAAMMVCACVGVIAGAACGTRGDGPRPGIYAISFDEVGGDCERKIHSAPEALDGWPPARRLVEVEPGLQEGEWVSFGLRFALVGDGWSCNGSFRVDATATHSGIGAGTAVLESNCNDQGQATCRHEFSASFTFESAAPDAAASDGGM